MNVELKEDFEIVEEGTTYLLPMYDIDENGLRRITSPSSEDALTHLMITFVRGSKDSEDGIQTNQGTLHEHLLAMMIHDLKYKNSLVPSREGSLVITKLEEALGWLRQRQIDRTKREVVGTYKK